MLKQGETIINVRTGQKITFLKTWLETNGTHLLAFFYLFLKNWLVSFFTD